MIHASLLACADDLMWWSEVLSFFFSSYMCTYSYVSFFKSFVPLLLLYWICVVVGDDSTWSCDARSERVWHQWVKQVSNIQPADNNNNSNIIRRHRWQAIWPIAIYVTIFMVCLFVCLSLLCIVLKWLKISTQFFRIPYDSPMSLLDPVKIGLHCSTPSSLILPKSHQPLLI